MKTTTFILTALLTLQFSVLHAGTLSGDLSKTTDHNTETLLTFPGLVPSVPRVADFSDAVTDTALQVDLTLLSPAVPVEADFEESLVSDTLTTDHLLPTTPDEADFSDQ